MTAGPVEPRLPSLRFRQGALVWLTPSSAYKFFWGTGARMRSDHEIQCFNAARECPVWGPYLLPVERSRIPRLLRSPRGAAIPAGGRRDQALRWFVEGRLRAAAERHASLPALQLIETGKLLAALGEPARRAIVDPVQDRLGGVLLPAGPTHGDLHRGNIVEAQGSYFLIDCDRYNTLSSPLFDRLHFSLTERRLTRHLKWVELLAESDDLIASAIDADGAVSATHEEVALAYGINRLALEAYGARLAGRPCAKYHRFAERLLERYGDGALRPAQRGRAVHG